MRQDGGEGGEQAREVGVCDGRAWGALVKREGPSKGMLAPEVPWGPKSAGRPGVSRTREADAQEAIEQVVADRLVQARVSGTLIGLHFTEPPFQA